MKKLSFLFAFLCASVMTFAATYKLATLDNVQPTDEVVIAWLKADAYYAITNSNGTSSAPAATAVIVSDDVLTTDNSALVWNFVKVEGGYTIYPAGVTDKWLYITASNNGVRVGTTEKTNIFAIDSESGYLTGNDGNVTRYLGIYNTQDVRCYTSVNTNIKGQEIKFFVKEEGGSTTDPVAVTGVTLDQATASLEVGNTLTLVATVAPENADNKNVSWKTSNAEVATVENGVVKAIAEGEATITATTEDGKFEATCVVTVTAAVVGTDWQNIHTSNVELSTTGGVKASKATVNDYAALKAGTSGAVGAVVIAVPAYTTKLYLHAAAWTGKPTAVTITGATITPSELSLKDNAGIAGSATDYEFSGDLGAADYFFELTLTGITEATDLTFTAKGDNRFVIWGVNYEQTIPDAVPATAIELDKTTLSLEQYKNTVALTATVTPANTTDVVTWTSSNEEVATISLSGVITALTEGTTTITARAGEVETTCQLTVIAPTALTCAEAAEIALAVSDNNVAAANGKYVVSGYIVEEVGDIESDMEQYQNISFWMADERGGANVFEAYRVVPVDKENLPKVGDKVEIVGDLTKYKTTPETLQGTATVRVVEAFVAVTGIELSADYADLVVGDVFTLTATIAPENATNKTIIWTSSDETAATVTDGVVTALAAAEEVIITASTEDGEFSATCSIFIYPAIETIAFSDEFDTTIELTDEALPLQLNITPWDASTKGLVLTSSDEQVITIEEQTWFGYTQYSIRTVGVGTATITATAPNGQTATITITVIPAKKHATEIALDQTELTIEVGDTYTFVVTLTPTDAEDILTWTSSNEEVATVADGVVTAVAVGTAYITVTTDAWREAMCKVTVNEGKSGIENLNAELDTTAPMYNVLGEQVNAEYKGVVIQNGKKFLLQ